MIDTVNLPGTTANLDPVEPVSTTLDRVSEVNQPQTDDRISISDTAKLVNAVELCDTLVPEDLDRIHQLQTAISNGTYHADSAKIADKLISDAETI